MKIYISHFKYVKIPECGYVHTKHNDVKTSLGWSLESWNPSREYSKTIGSMENGIFTYIYHTNQLSVCQYTRYTSPMDPLGNQIFSTHSLTQSSHGSSILLAIPAMTIRLRSSSKSTKKNTKKSSGTTAIHLHQVFVAMKTCLLVSKNPDQNSQQNFHIALNKTTMKNASSTLICLPMATSMGTILTQRMSSFGWKIEIYVKQWTSYRRCFKTGLEEVMVSYSHGSLSTLSLRRGRIQNVSNATIPHLSPHA